MALIARRARTLEVLSVSAIDLFASALGMFILIAIMLFPFYLRSPSLEQDKAGAEAERQAASAALAAARARASEEAERIAQAKFEAEQAALDLSVAMTELQAAKVAFDDAVAERNAAEGEAVGLDERLANVPIRDLDLVIVMDTTGSMRNEIEDVRSDLVGIVNVLFELAPTLHVGFVAYRDIDSRSGYLTRKFPLQRMDQTSLRRLRAFVAGLDAYGGGNSDPPERVGAGLVDALRMDWRDRAEGRIIVIGDAPAHKLDWELTYSYASRFSGPVAQGRAFRRLSTIYTGGFDTSMRPAGLRFFKELSESGQGDFTQHRGRMMESVLLSILEDAGDDAWAVR